MAIITGKYKGNLINELVYSGSGDKIIVDASHEIDSKSFTPTDLIGAALAACIITTMGVIAKNHDFSIDGTSYELNITMADAPRRMRQIDIVINFPQIYTEKQRIMLSRATNKCPVKNSIREDIIVNLKMNFPE